MDGWMELFCSPVIDACALCYRPSCQNCSHLAVLFEFAATRILLQHKKRDNDMVMNAPDTVLVGIVLWV